MSKENEIINAVNLVSNGTTVKGDIESNSGIRIDGQMKGKMSIKGKVVIGTSGVITGDIFCQTIEVAGQVTGNIQAAELVSLKSSSKTHGEIVTRKLSIEPGAIFTGTCKMDSEANAKQTELPSK